MSTQNEIGLDPNNTPNQNWVKKLDSRSMAFNLNSVKASNNDRRIIIPNNRIDHCQFRTIAYKNPS